MQRFYQKFICKVKQNFRGSTLGNTFIVHDDTKKDKFHSNEPVGLFLQCIIRITECGKSDDEGKRDAVFNGFFQGGHGKHMHR